MTSQPENDKVGFKAGFLARCSEQGLSMQQVESRVDEALLQIKRASLWEGAKTMGGAAGTAWAATTPAAKNLWWALSRSLLPVGATGAAAGYGLAKMTDVDETDVDEAKKRELIDEYRRQASRLVHRRKTYL